MPFNFAKRPHALRFACGLWPRPPVASRIPWTFDDGPHPEWTPQVLARLKSHRIRAIFFVVGERVLQYPQIVRQIVADGHVLGNHTHTHPRLPQWGFRRAWQELDQCQRAVTAAVGKPPEWFRPPYGRWTWGLRRAAARAELQPLFWTLDSNDWRCRTEADASHCAASLLAAVCRGDVVLFHDAHPFIGSILDRVLPQCASRFGDEWSARGPNSEG